MIVPLLPALRLTFPTLLCAVLLAVHPTGPARSDAVTASRADIQAGYARSVAARRAGAPEVAERILRDLIDRAPRAGQLRFDLGVALAEQGRCLAAALAFDTGARIVGTPGFARARDQAMADLCPRLARFEATLDARLVYDTNGNSGARSSRINVGGLDLTLGGDAVAKELYGTQISGSLAYNQPLDGQAFIVPTLGVGLSLYQDPAHDSLSTSFSLLWRMRGDRVDWRLGPTWIREHDRTGVLSTGQGVTARASVTLSETSGLYLGASALSIDSAGGRLTDYTQTDLRATWVRALPGPDVTVRAGTQWSDVDYVDPYQDLRSLRVHAGVAGTLTDGLGYDLSASRERIRGHMPHFLFGTERADTVTTMTGRISMGRWEGWWGRPYTGLSHTVSDSTWASKDFDRTQVLFGLTRSF